MKKMKFILKSDKNIEIEEECSYYIKDDVIKFKIDSIIYEYDLNNKILVKKDKEQIKIDFNNKNIIITLQEYNKDFFLPIENVSIKETKKRLEITYEIEEENKVCRQIIIEY